MKIVGPTVLARNDVVNLRREVVAYQRPPTQRANPTLSGYEQREVLPVTAAQSPVSSFDPLSLGRKRLGPAHILSALVLCLWTLAESFLSLLCCWRSITPTAFGQGFRCTLALYVFAPVLRDTSIPLLGLALGRRVLHILTWSATAPASLLVGSRGVRSTIDTFGSYAESLPSSSAVPFFNRPLLTGGTPDRLMATVRDVDRTDDTKPPRFGGGSLLYNRLVHPAISVWAWPRRLLPCGAPILSRLQPSEGCYGL